MNNEYKLTTFSCFVGIFTQAIVTNLIAILFIPLKTLYGLSYVDLGILVAVNFATQVGADLIFSGIIDKVGFRKLILPTTLIAFTGLAFLGFTPFLFPNNIFLGVVIATIIFAFSSGLLEVLVSPIVDSMPSDNKGGAMSLMHSFYAWGQVATIILTTLLIFILGNEYWFLIALIWSVVPLINFFMFLKSKLPDTKPSEEMIKLKDMIFNPLYILALLAIMLGAITEVTLNQWVSTFAEKALLISKVSGDLIGMCGFALMLGFGRALHGKYHDKMNIHNVLISGASLSALCYIVAAVSPFNSISLVACVFCGFGASLLWPGTLVIASDNFPKAGAWMFAILAAAGDIGAAIGPWLTGVIVDSSVSFAFTQNLSILLNLSTEQACIRTGILFASIFPALTVVVHLIWKSKSNKLK